MKTETMATEAQIAEEIGGTYWFGGAAAALALVLALVGPAIPARADDLVLIPPEEQPYLINPSAAGVDTLEAFMEPPGTSFGSPGFINLDPGWAYIDVNRDYSTEYGPASTALTEDLDVIGNTTFVADFYGFTGCSSLEPVAACPLADLTDAYAVYFTNGVYQGWTPLTADDLSGENTSPDKISSANPSDGSGVATPEPMTATLIGGALIALGILKRKPKSALAGESRQEEAPLGGASRLSSIGDSIPIWSGPNQR